MVISVMVCKYKLLKKRWLISSSGNGRNMNSIFVYVINSFVFKYCLCQGSCAAIQQQHLPKRCCASSRKSRPSMVIVFQKTYTTWTDLCTRNLSGCGLQVGTVRERLLHEAGPPRSPVSGSLDLPVAPPPLPRLQRNPRSFICYCHWRLCAHETTRARDALFLRRG